MGKPIETCCDTNMLKTMDAQVSLAANFLKRCPSCLQNFLQYLCSLTCAPDQSRFINVTETEEEEPNKRKPKINTI